ncbi:hypothetical protein [Mesorhizobium japonicum]|uniref:hypothetical protein n=1 Tax=Mesorhizobium japonicum TaxID=2066070 RepID=UPI003B5B20A3
MAIHGIEFVIGVPRAVGDVDDWIDTFYSSLKSNFPIESVDLGWNEDKGSLSVLLGIRTADGLDADSLVSGTAVDAIKRALSAIGMVVGDADEATPAPSARVLEFA